MFKLMVPLSLVKAEVSSFCPSIVTVAPLTGANVIRYLLPGSRETVWLDFSGDKVMPSASSESLMLTKLVVCSTETVTLTG